MKKAIQWLDVNFEAILMVVFFILMILLVTLQVILRFFFESGFSWGEEIARILFVWMAFSSFGYLTRNGRHVRVGFLAEKFSDDIKKVIFLICDILFLIFSIFGLKAVISLCIDAAKYNDMLTSILWSINVMYFAGFLGFLMMTIRNIQVIVWKIINWNKPIDRFMNYDGMYYKSNKICFEPAVKDKLEQLEAEAEEKLGLGE